MRRTAALKRVASRYARELLRLEPRNTPRQKIRYLDQFARVRNAYIAGAIHGHNW